MNTPLNLQPFCFSEADFHEDADSFNLRMLENIGTPFSHEDFTYATNGRIAVRVPRRGDVPERSSAPGGGAKGIFNDMTGKGRLRPLPPIPDYNPDQPLQSQKVQIGAVAVDAKYLRLIQQNLPNVKISDGETQSETEYPCLTFTFDGGEGRLMPFLDDAHRGEVKKSLPVINLVWQNASGQEGMKSLIEWTQAQRLIEKLLTEGVKSITIQAP